jgi:multidrug efflux pump subunit AcrB
MMIAPESSASGSSTDITAGHLNHPVGRLSAMFYKDLRLTALTLLLIAASGISSFFVLTRREDPMLTPRVAQVSTIFPGANAERVEALVTEKIERKLRDVPEIKQLMSNSRAGASFITIELMDEVRDPARIWPRVRGKVEDSISLLPKGALRPEFDEVEMSAYAWIGGLTWTDSSQPSYAVLRRLALELKDQLLTVEGTKRIDLYGDPKEEVLVELDATQMAATGITPAMIARRLSEADVKSSAGMLRSDSGETVVQFNNQFDSLEDIADAEIDTATPGHSLRLKDIATLSRGTPEPALDKALLDGRPAVFVGVFLRNDYRIDRWTQAIAPVLQSFSQSLPPSVKLELLMEQNGYVSQRMNSLASNMLMGIAAVTVATFLLMGWRSSLLVTATLPVASLMVLTGMRILDIPIHQMSVTGLIIALGMLIDNAIIAADEVEISLRRGFSAADAALDMVARLFAPLVASTLTTVFAFAPIALMEGPSGEFVGSIALTVIMAVTCSLFLSLTILPAMAAWLQDRVAHGTYQGERFHFFRQLWRHGIAIDWLTEAYRRSLRFIVAYPISGIALGLALPVAGFVAATQLPEQFFPPSDRDQFHIEIEMDSQASMAQTQKLVKRLDQRLKTEDRVRQSAWFFGNSVPSFYYNVITRVKNTPNYAHGVINLNGNHQIGDLIRRLQVELDHEFPEARVLVRQLEQGPPFDAPVELRIFGPDIDRLAVLGEQVRLIGSELPNVIHTKSTLSSSRPMAHIKVNAGQAGWAGLTEQEISDQLFSRLEGLQAGTIIEETEELPVRVRLAGQHNVSLDTLRESGLIASPGLTNAATARSDGGSGPVLTSLVPVSSVAEIDLSPQRAIVPRYGGVRMDEIKFYLTAGTLPATVLKQLQQAMDAQGFSLPSGYRLDLGGEAKERNSAVSRLMANVSILLVGMVASMAIALGSFRLTGLISLVAFLSVGLGMGALWCFGFSFGFMAIIGTMGLVGVAVNDSIVVASSLKANPMARQGDQEAMVETIIEVTRHVLATTVTTVAGFLPLMLGGGAFWPPLAVTIGAGVLGATLIALVFVPSAMRLTYLRS